MYFYMVIKELILHLHKFRLSLSLDCTLNNILRLIVKNKDPLLCEICVEMLNYCIFVWNGRGFYVVFGG